MQITNIFIISVLAGFGFGLGAVIFFFIIDFIAERWVEKKK
jgi:hypothetical protein